MCQIFVRILDKHNFDIPPVWEYCTMAPFWTFQAQRIPSRSRSDSLSRTCRNLTVTMSTLKARNTPDQKQHTLSPSPISSPPTVDFDLLMAVRGQVLTMLFRDTLLASASAEEDTGDWVCSIGEPRIRTSGKRQLRIEVRDSPRAGYALSQESWTCQEYL